VVAVVVRVARVGKAARVAPALELVLPVEMRFRGNLISGRIL